jgi:hypothetical protein
MDIMDITNISHNAQPGWTYPFSGSTEQHKNTDFSSIPAATSKSSLCLRHKPTQTGHHHHGHTTTQLSVMIFVISVLLLDTFVILYFLMIDKGASNGTTSFCLPGKFA